MVHTGNKVVKSLKKGDEIKQLKDEVQLLQDEKISERHHISWESFKKLIEVPPFAIDEFTKAVGVIINDEGITVVYVNPLADEK